MRGRKPDVIAQGDITDADRAPPEYLSEDAKIEWLRVFPLLVERRALAESDLSAFENYCEAQGTVRVMARQIALEGHTYISEGGAKKKNPAVGVQAEAFNRARLLAAELGLTPVSRARRAGSGGDGGFSVGQTNFFIV